MKFSVAIPSYKRPARLAKCLAALSVQNRPADEVIVVGQGDDRATRGVLSAYGRYLPEVARWRYLHLPEPNIVTAENAAVSFATGDVVAFIDDDAVAGPRWLEIMEKWYEDPRVGGVGGPYIEHREGKPEVEFAKKVGKFTWYGRYVDKQWCLTARPLKVDVLTGGNMSFRRALVPLIPDDFRPYWHAFEVYIACAVRRRGYSVVFDPALAVDHFPEDRRRYYSFGPGPIEETVLRLTRNNAHNFIFAALAHDGAFRRLPLLLYEFSVGERGRPGLIRALLMYLEGRGRDAGRFLPATKGKLEGLLTYLRSLFIGRKRLRSGQEVLHFGGGRSAF